MNEIVRLEVQGITAGYSGSTVVDDVTLTAEAARITALVGPNGAGKTTLLRTIGGFLKPRHGRVLLNGIDVTGQAPHKIAARGISNVLEGRRVFRDMTVGENLGVAASRARRGVPTRSIGEMYELFPILAARRGLPASALSGGEQQMLAIASSLLTPTQFLLIDELSLGLAPRVVADILVTLRALADTGVGVLLVEQSVRQAVGNADQLYVLAAGRIALSVVPSETDAVEATVSSFLGGAV